VALVVLPVVEARVDKPLVPLELFRSRNFTGANLTTIGVYAALQGTMFLVVLYVQNMMGYSAFLAGLVLAPISLLLLLLSSLAGTLSGQYGPRLFMSLGPIVIGLGLVLLARIGPDASIWTDLLPAVTVFGLGLAGTVAPLTDTVMSSVPSRRSGIAAALNNVVSRVAGLLAIAALGAILALTFSGVLGERLDELALPASVEARVQELADRASGGFDLSGLPPEARSAVQVAYTVAFRRAVWIAAGLAVLGGATAAAVIRNPEDEGSNDE
jgi:hypothetical protein